uniref:Uncharacterized protein n=1 Tax=Kalanchoe fedtschenkoi TaxID=63787 RepID=A0A7N1A3L5_KALFE
MSVINSSELQIWDNAAFDCGDSLDGTSLRNSWSSISAFQSFDKENHDTTTMTKSPPSFTTPKPLHPISRVVSNRRTVAKDLSNCVYKQAGLITPLGNVERNEDGFVREEKQIDKEIEDVEKEIDRLNSRLQELKREKTEKNARMAFTEQVKKQSFKNLDRLKKLEESMLSSSSAGAMRRRLSLGPSEIITPGAKTRQMMEALTHVDQKQNRRKSCFWKLDQIDELKETKERRKSLSLSPISKKAASKLPKQAATTTGSKKMLKKIDSVISSVQPKKLFREGEKIKKPVRAGRVIASRYNSSNNNQVICISKEKTGLRKRSLPENEESKGNEKKRASLGLKSCSKEGVLEQQQGRAKKKWDIPTEVVVFDSSTSVDDDQNLLPSGADGLPKIRTVRCVNETPRDSGAVKRAAELGDKKSAFCEDDEQGKWVCQALSFEED